MSAFLAPSTIGGRAYLAPASPTSAPSTNTIAVVLQNRADVPLSGPLSLKWALFSQATPNLFNAPAAQGLSNLMAINGIISISVPADTVPVGRYWLLLTDSDGTTTQSPPARSFSCPVMVT